MKVTVLGCGASSGVPLIGCTCDVCTSPNPKNKRTRVSIVVQTENTTILVDTSPDMRAQCLAQGLSKVDAIIYSHAHADHLHGIDDTRIFNHTKNAPVDIYGDEEVLGHISRSFGYVFQPPKRPVNGPEDWGWYRPCLVPHTIEAYKPFTIGDMEVLPIDQKHGTGRTMGFRFGPFAYSTDVNGLTEEALQALEGIDTWIVDCLRYDPAPTHAHLELTLSWIARIKPRRAYLTHMNHGLEYDTLAVQLPDGVFPAYDGLKLEIK